MAFVCAVAGVVWFSGRHLTLAGLAEHEAEFRQFQMEHPIAVYIVAFTVYVVVTALSVPGATAMTLVFAWLFGFWRALVIVSFGSTTGATIAMLLSRHLLRDSVTRRFGDRLKSFDDALKREGASFLLTLRLIPAVPFFVINAVMGLTPMRVTTFWWVSQLGMLPATALYVYAGSRVPQLQILADEGVRAVFTRGQMAQILAAFVLLGLFPLIVRIAVRRRSGSTPESADD
ncbi:MAG: TVP38/TMEM64 family protein [Planctomycetaceae bacterium]